MENKSLWERIGNKCLEKAENLINEETATTAETIEAVKSLVDIAISIDMLNLHWATQNRYGAELHKGQIFRQT